MEEPTFTAIDYNSLENRVIEGLVGDYYQMVKNTFEDLERIKREGEPKLPPLTFEEPKIYP